MAYLEAIDLGTKKKTARTAVSGSLTAAGTETIDLSSYLPKGTKAVELFIGATDATPGTAIGIRRTGGSVSENALYIQAASIPNYLTCDVVLDAALSFDLYKTAGFDVVSVFITGYYL